MKGWILYKHSDELLMSEAYEIQRFIEVAESVGIDLRVVAPEQFDLVVPRDDRKSVLLDGQVAALPDFLLPRMGVATSYFALAVIRQLERLGVHSFNSSTCIETVKDKLYTLQILAESNLPVAKSMLAKFPVDLEVVEKQIGFPVVVKTLSGTQGAGVFLCEDRRSLQDLMELVTATRSNVNIILQEFIESSRGRDLRVITLGGRAVGAMLRQSQDGSFKANVSRGGTGASFKINAEVEWLASEVARRLGLDIAGIDLLFDGDHFRICEANSAPGFRGLETYTGINMPREVFSFIAVRLGHFDVLSRLNQLRDERTDEESERHSEQEQSPHLLVTS